MVSHLHLSLLFVVKAKSEVPSEATLGYAPALPPKIRNMEVSKSGKHSSLLQFRINYSCKIVYSTDLETYQ